MVIPHVHLSEDENIPIMGLGTWQLQGQDCIATIQQALEIGYTHFDTAEIYGNEQAIGQALQGEERTRIFLTSKVWRDNLSRDAVLRACQDSLERLRTEYLDLYLVHWPNKEVPMKETFGAMKRLYDEGKIRSVGVSNFTVAHLEEALAVSDVPIVANQVEFHVLLYQKELKTYCDEHGITLIAYSPLGHGELIDHPVLAEIGEKHDCSAAQVALAWLINKDVVVIPKASSEEHLRDNLDALEVQLDETDMERLDALDANERFINPSFAEFGRAKA